MANDLEFCDISMIEFAKKDTKTINEEFKNLAYNGDQSILNQTEINLFEAINKDKFTPTK